MPNPSSTSERLIPLLSHRPRHLLRAMITINNLPKPSDTILTYPVWANRVSSLGVLDRLPPEILSMLLSLLDIQSIIRFACTSIRGSTLVRAYPAYRDLVAFAPHVLVALSRVGLLGHQSVVELHATLKAEQCASCIEYGAFLFLPTCERCCWECLRYNPSLRMLLPSQAKRYFGLSERHLRQLHLFQVIPGNYGICADAAPKNCRLVSVKAANSLGLLVHGSAEKLAQAMERRCKSSKLLITGRYLQRGPATPQAPSWDLLFLPTQGNIPNDKFFGMASIPFPSLSKSGGSQDGLWCRGCEGTLRQYDRLRLRNDILAATVPPNCEPHRILLGLERRARSKESLLDHVKHCYGARQLVPELAISND